MYIKCQQVSRIKSLVIQYYIITCLTYFKVSGTKEICFCWYFVINGVNLIIVLQMPRINIMLGCTKSNEII